MSFIFLKNRKERELPERNPWNHETSHAGKQGKQTISQSQRGQMSMKALINMLKKNQEELDVPSNYKLGPSPVLQEMLLNKQGDEARLNVDPQDLRNRH